MMSYNLNSTGHMKKYSDILVINLAFLILGIFLYFLTGKNIEILGAVMATGISLSLGVRQSKAENDRIFKELFTEFNTKYDTKFNRELDIIVKNEQNDLNTEQVYFVIDYINFCAEEYLWRTKGRIPDEVWNSWEKGMVYYFGNPLIYKIFFNERMQKDSYYGLYERIEKILNGISKQ